MWKNNIYISFKKIIYNLKKEWLRVTKRDSWISRTQKTDNQKCGAG